MEMLQDLQRDVLGSLQMGPQRTLSPSIMPFQILFPGPT